MAAIKNGDNWKTVNGTSKADSINNSGSFVTIDAGKGNDSIKNSAENVIIFGGDGNNTIRNSGEEAVLVGGGSGSNVIISTNGNSTLLGGTGNNTLTGGEGANVFIHRNGATDVIKNYDLSEDIIILEQGKVAESLTSDDGNDIILKIADGDNDLGTITVKDVEGTYLTIYDEDTLNESKATFFEFSAAYIKSAVKTFEEDEDIQSILTNGENSDVLSEIKALNPDLAKQIAEALTTAYESGTAYLETIAERQASVSGSSEGCRFYGDADPSVIIRILEKISEFDRIIICRHRRPDGDATGASGGLCELIRAAFPEKKVMISNREKSAFAASHTSVTPSAFSPSSREQPEDMSNFGRARYT